jgi:hypothetical protein
MSKHFFLIFIAHFIIAGFLKAQDTLPKFTVKDKTNGRIILSWVNKYVGTKQITIQRSTDSVKNFKSIASMPKPDLEINGFSDTKLKQGEKYFYRLFIMLPNAKFITTKSVRPEIDTAWKNRPIPTIDSIVMSNIPPPPKPKINTPVKFVAKYVFNYNGGDIILKLEGANAGNPYKAVFYKNGELIMELTNLIDEEIIVDRVNFVKKGCYNYEIWNEDKIVEKHLICL